MGGGMPPGATRVRRTAMGGGSPPGATRGGGPSWEEDCRQGEEDRRQGPLGKEDLHGSRIAARGHHEEDDCRQGLLVEEDCRQGPPGGVGSRQGPLGEQDRHGKMTRHRGTEAEEEHRHERRTAARGRRTFMGGGMPPGATRGRRIATGGGSPPGGVGSPPGATIRRTTAAKGH
ncbi:hypothetical protein ACOMHN_031943 [Nucella lapillus]